MAAELNRHLLADNGITGVALVGAFLAFDGEPDVRFTLTQLARRGVGVALPVLPDDSKQPLCWRRWTPATPLSANRYGISEPLGTAEVHARDINALLMPLVAWDRQGTRLGMGGGWYDRSLADPELRARRIGVAWTLQEAEAPLPRDPWDAPLDAVVTESGWFTCPPRDATMATAGDDLAR